MKAPNIFAILGLVSLFVLMPQDAHSAVWVSAVTITDLGGTGCHKSKTSSVNTVPASRYAHSLTIDWTHHITVAGVIGGIHSGVVSEENTNAAIHSDEFSNNPGTNIIVYAEAQFSMQYCDAGGQLIELNSPVKNAQQAC